MTNHLRDNRANALSSVFQSPILQLSAVTTQASESKTVNLSISGLIDITIKGRRTID